MTSDWYGPQGYAAAEQPYAPYPSDVPYRTESPAAPASRAAQAPPAPGASPAAAPVHPYPPYGPHGTAHDAGRATAPDARGAGDRGQHAGYGGGPAGHRDAAGGLDDATVALRTADILGASIPGPPPGAPSGAVGAPEAAGEGATPAGGRAARRKAAKGRRGRHGGTTRPAGPAGPGEAEPGRPLTRMEARRLARSRRPGPAVVVSRAIGEVFITTGVLMLLFVTYQLWWTNVRAHAQAGSEASDLQKDWASGRRSPGTFEPGEGFAILRIPDLDVVVPIAEGVSGKKVLDRGMVGHYGEGDLKTAMPDAKTGNFGLAGHRNTHGEPFRYINRLRPGAPIVVETRDTYYVYKMTSTLPVTPPSNVSVLDPVPKDSGFTGPGRYITLTTCTPEFTSKYRLIVWGKMVEERPRSEGKPDALVR